LVPKSTLDDLERPYCTLLHKDASFGAHDGNVKKDRPNCQERKCSLRTGNEIVYADIRWEFLGKGALNECVVVNNI